MRALLAGMGAAEALAHPGEARVLATLPRALYVATPGGIAAFVAPGVDPGPLHVLLDAAPTREAARIGLAGVPVWRGALPDPGSLAAALPLVLQVLDPVAGSNLVPAERATAAVLALARGDLPEAATRLGGAGPGLTPAGDDALGGILFARRAIGGDACGDDLVAIASGVHTTGISGAFLLWAARGQALAPVHDLLAAAVAGDVAGAASAARALGGIGHSSGADFAQGLSWGLRLAPGARVLSGRPQQTSSITQPPGPLLTTDNPRGTTKSREDLCSNEGTCSRNSAADGAEPSSRHSAWPSVWASSSASSASPRG